MIHLTLIAVFQADLYPGVIPLTRTLTDPCDPDCFISGRTVLRSDSPDPGLAVFQAETHLALIILFQADLYSGVILLTLTLSDPCNPDCFVSGRTLLRSDSSDAGLAIFQADLYSGVIRLTLTLLCFRPTCTQERSS